MSPLYDLLPLLRPYRSLPHQLLVTDSARFVFSHSRPLAILLQRKNTIPFPVRLFVRADLVMSRYGTLVWLNSEADLISPTSAFAPTDSEYLFTYVNMNPTHGRPVAPK